MTKTNSILIDAISYQTGLSRTQVSHLLGRDPVKTVIDIYGISITQYKKIRKLMAAQSTSFDDAYRSYIEGEYKKLNAPVDTKAIAKSMVLKAKLNELFNGPFLEFHKITDDM